MATPAISVAPNTDTIRSCNHCLVSNYDFGSKKAEPNLELFDIRIPHNAVQTSVIVLCRSCLTDLAGALQPFRGSFIS